MKFHFRLNRASVCLLFSALLMLVAFSRADARTIDARVPFASQAPTAEWGNRIYQDGCEEASMVMAHAWATGKPLTRTSALKGIKALTALEEKLFGRYVADTSAEDTARVMKQYFRMGGVSVQRDITKRDIIARLRAGKILLVPVNGRLLANPNYKPPGPLLHMLVIRGYDDRADVFITNDPGTRKGEGYRYRASVLVSAIRDYPTGNHMRVTGNAKSMIVVERGKKSAR